MEDPLGITALRRGGDESALLPPAPRGGRAQVLASRHRSGVKFITKFLNDFEDVYALGPRQVPCPVPEVLEREPRVNDLPSRRDRDGGLHRTRMDGADVVEGAFSAKGLLVRATGRHVARVPGRSGRGVHDRTVKGLHHNVTGSDREVHGTKREFLNRHKVGDGGGHSGGWGSRGGGWGQGCRGTHRRG